MSSPNLEENNTMFTPPHMDMRHSRLWTGAKSSQARERLTTHGL